MKRRKIGDGSLTGSLFGGGSGGDDKSLTSSIFGHNDGGEGKNDSLFSIKEGLTEAVQARLEENVAKAKANEREQGKANNTESVPRRDLSTKEIMEIRRKQSSRSRTAQYCSEAPFPAAAAGAPAAGGSKSAAKPLSIPPEEAVEEIAQMVRQHGFVVMRNTVGKEILDALSERANQLQEEICGELDKRNIAWRCGQKDAPEEFRFREVASRCNGRMDSRHGTQDPPFTDKLLMENPSILSVVNALLGGSNKSTNSLAEGGSQFLPRLVYAGLILSFPGSNDQPWHQDGMPLFAELDEDGHPVLPPYALNVFLPLTDQDAVPEAGPTEFVPASHRLPPDRVMQTVAQQKAEIVGPVLQQGDCLVYDYRVCHRGTSNLTATKKKKGGRVRRILYLMYARPWFKEHMNFGTESLFPKSP